MTAMPPARHILCLAEFYHPDICASAVVAADHLGRIARERPDWRITVIAGNRSWNDPAAVYPASDTHDGVRIVRVPRPPMRRQSLWRRAQGFWEFGRGAVRAARSLGLVDLVIGTTAPPHGGLLARKIARRLGCLYVYKVLDLYPDSARALGRVRSKLVLGRWESADTRAMRGAAAVVTISQAMKQRVERTRGLAGEKLAAIHDGYDDARLNAAGENQFRARHNPNSAFVAQYAGNMGLSHPLDTIVEAARRLAAEPGILFQFIGDGPQRACLASGLPSNAQMLDYEPAENLGHVLQSADVCLISQHLEMFDLALPYKIYSSLAAGRPVVFIGSARSEIAEWLAESGAGWRLNQGDAAGLAALLVQLKANREMHAVAAGAARRLFEARFDSARAAAQWVELLDAVLTNEAREIA